MVRKFAALLIMAAIGLGFSGCAGLAGAGAAAGAYEYQNKEALNKLEEQYEAGDLSREEYLQRKEDIESGSIVY